MPNITSISVRRVEVFLGLALLDLWLHYIGRNSLHHTLFFQPTRTFAWVFRVQGNPLEPLKTRLKLLSSYRTALQNIEFVDVCAQLRYKPNKLSQFYFQHIYRYGQALFTFPSSFIYAANQLLRFSLFFAGN